MLTVKNLSKKHEGFHFVLVILLTLVLSVTNLLLKKILEYGVEKMA